MGPPVVVISWEGCTAHVASNCIRRRCLYIHMTAHLVTLCLIGALLFIACYDTVAAEIKASANGLVKALLHC